MVKALERRWDEMRKTDMTLTQVVEDYLNDLRIQRKSPKTINFYLRNLGLFQRWLKRHNHTGTLEDLNLVTAKRYIFYLEEERRKFEGHPFIPEQNTGLSLYSVRGHVRTLKAFTSWLYREEYFEDNVLARLKLPKAPKIDIKVLTDDEVKTLLSAINPNTSSGARNYSILLLMLDSGLRMGEVIGLKIPKTDVANLLTKTDIAPQRRPETLTLEEWAQLWQAYTQWKGKKIAC